MLLLSNPQSTSGLPSHPCSQMWACEWILVNEKWVEELFGISWEAVGKELICWRRASSCPLLFLLPTPGGLHGHLAPGGGFEGEATSQEEGAERWGPEFPRTPRAAIHVLHGQHVDFYMREK